MRYKCRFNFDYDDFMSRRYTFELIYKPNKLLASKRRVRLYSDSNFISDDFDKSINKCIEGILNMSQEDFIKIAIEKIKKNEFIIDKDRLDKNEFNNKLNKLNKKLNKFKFEVDI